MTDDRQKIALRKIIFAPNHCPLCLTLDQENDNKSIFNGINTCVKCKLVSYCSGDHQKQDKEKHEPFCAAVVELCTNNNIDHIFDIYCPIKNVSATVFQTTKFLIKQLITIKMKRQLKTEECNMIDYPRVCNICYEYKASCLKECNGCQSVFYCSAQHEKQDKQNHSKYCSALKVNVRFSSFSFQEFFILPIQPQEPIPKQLTNLLDLMKHFTTILCTEHPTTYEEYSQLSSVSYFSFVGTIIYVLSTVDMIKEDTTNITIDIVGCTVESECLTSKYIWLLFRVFPNLKKVHFNLIGPQLDVGLIGTETKLKRVKYTQSTDKYLEFTEKNPSRETPNAIIAFNCGFAEYSGADIDTWRPSLRRMLDYKNIPIAFTSYTQNESYMDLLALYKSVECDKNKYQLNAIITDSVNPFKDYRPLRNCDRTDREEMFYFNGFINIIISKD